MHLLSWGEERGMADIGGMLSWYVLHVHHLCVCVFLCISILFVNVRAQSQRCPLPCPFKKFCFILSFLFFSRLSTSFCSYLSSSSLSLFPGLSFVLCFFWTQCDWFTFYESTHFAFSFCLSLTSFFACTFDLPLCIRFYYLFIFLSFLLCFFFLQLHLFFFCHFQLFLPFPAYSLFSNRVANFRFGSARPSQPIDMQFVAQL